ncbi:COG3650 family protein [Sphingobium lactosutens]|uniref:COG3650 family protein n=1 Tax=Sphingobium lactosutens TaxID=522773 RepID=UPI003569E8AA
MALLSLALLGACGGEKAPAADNQSMLAANAVIAPINDAVVNSDSEMDNLAEPDAPLPKPLVSRETSPRPAPPDYRAIGTEPFWAVTVRGSTATLERPDKPPIRYAISRNADDRAIRYLGDGFAMTATQGPCSDGMSDTIWSDRVQIAFGEGTLKGCGGERDDGGYAH